MWAFAASILNLLGVGDTRLLHHCTAGRFIAFDTVSYVHYILPYITILYCTNKPALIIQATGSVTRQSQPPSGTPGTGPQPKQRLSASQVPSRFLPYFTMNPPRKIGQNNKNNTFSGSTTSTAGDNMTSMAAASTAGLDLFILTFNAAKNLIDVPVFGAHLGGALGQNGDGLPDLVAL